MLQQFQLPKFANHKNSINRSRSRHTENVDYGSLNRSDLKKHENKVYNKILLEAEYEYKRRGKFDLIFPFFQANTINVYKDLFCHPQKEVNQHLMDRFQKLGIFFNK